MGRWRFEWFLGGRGRWVTLVLGLGHGRIYAFSGKDGSILFTSVGENALDNLGGGGGNVAGNAVATAGDVNLDGIPDVLACAPNWDDPASGSTTDNRGRVYVLSVVDVPLTADEHLLTISQASTSNLSLDAGIVNANHQYWVFGNFAFNGSFPGVTLGSVNIPLNPDPWTQVTIDFVSTPALFNTRGTLDSSGQASASLNSLGPIPAPLGLTLQHCFLVFQSGSPDQYFMASNLVPWTTVP